MPLVSQSGAPDGEACVDAQSPGDQCPGDRCPGPRCGLPVAERRRSAAVTAWPARLYSLITFQLLQA